MAVKDRVIFLPRGPRGLPGPQGVTGDPSVETTRIDKIESLFDKNPNIHLDAINGNDLNSGSVANPVATFGKALSLCKAGFKNSILLMSDIMVNERHEISKDTNITFVTYSYSTLPKNKISFVNTPTGVCGGITVEDGNSVGIQFLKTILELDSSDDSGGVLYARFCSRFGVRTWDCEVHMTVQNQARLFYSSLGGLFDVLFQVTPFTGVEGFLFSGIDSGDNPNSLWYNRSNIISG